MIGKLKAFGLAIVAIVVVSIAAASTAQASELHITSGGHTGIFGQQTAQKHKLQLTAVGISTSCNQVLFEGTQNGSFLSQTTTQELTLTAIYTGCTIFGLNVVIDMNGCKYTVTGEGEAALTARVAIVGCTQTDKKPYGAPGGTGITQPIDSTVAGICRVTVPEQSTVGGHVTLANEGQAPTESVNAQFALQGITYQTHNCPGIVNTETRQDADYTGTATFQARVDEGSEQVVHNGHQYDKLRQTGALVGILAT